MTMKSLAQFIAEASAKEIKQGKEYWKNILKIGTWYSYKYKEWNWKEPKTAYFKITSDNFRTSLGKYINLLDYSDGFAINSDGTFAHKIVGTSVCLVSPEREETLDELSFPDEKEVKQIFDKANKLSKTDLTFDY